MIQSIHDMVMELKDVYYIIGSTLGIATFFQTLGTSLVTANKEKWEKVKEVVTESDLQNLEYQVWGQRRVDPDAGSYYSKISNFVHDIESNAEYLRFGPLHRSEYKKHLSEFARLCKQFDDRIGDEHWCLFRLRKEGEADDNPDAKYVHQVDKGSFTPRDAYVRYLEETSDIVEKNEGRVPFPLNIGQPSSSGNSSGKKARSYARPNSEAHSAVRTYHRQII